MDALIGVDLRARGRAAHAARQMRTAVDLVLGSHPARAHESGVRAVDGATATLAADARVVAILGPFRSADTAAVLPTINSHGTAMVSASNTYVPLTLRGPSFRPDEPERFYAHGRRTYVRLFPNDFHQGAALVQLAKSMGVQRPFILHDDAPYGLAVSEAFGRAASAAGLHVVAASSWHVDGPAHVARAGADALVLCGGLDQHSDALIRDKVRRLGPNTGVKLLAGDGFLTGEPLDSAAAGMVALAPGLRHGYLPEAAEEFVEVLSSQLGIRANLVEPYAIHAAEAIALLLQAIDRVGVSRVSLVQSVFDGTTHAGRLGEYTITHTGDVAAEASPILGFSVYKATRTGVFALDGGVVPSPTLVAAAFA